MTRMLQISATGTRIILTAKIKIQFVHFFVTFNENMNKISDMIEFFKDT